jgi:two-component system response regulator AtoC
VSDATTIDATQGGGPASPLNPPLAYLLVRQGDATQVIDLHDGDDIVFGRSSDATVPLDDARASREHARVRRDGPEMRLTDLGSRNGTRLNGQALEPNQERTIRSGDVIGIGHVEIVVAETSAVRRGGELRLPSEVARLKAAGGEAALLRVDGDARRMANVPVLQGAELVEEQPDGAYACLFPSAAEATRAADELRAAGFEVSSAALGDGSEDAASLWRRAAGAEPQRADETPDGVIVAEAAMVKVFDLVRRVAKAPTTVLILGETGVGKEVVAEQVHVQSPRAKGPFVRLNCGSLPETLLESELFGHEKGAFTGADRKKTGYLDSADGGTLFLDEVGELALTMQAKLLRVLESRSFMRVGGREEIAVDVRILAATNRDLLTEVKTGKFREDLYFRLAAFTIEIPPLRERPSEIALLAELFLRRFAEGMGVPVPAIAPDAAAALRRYRWPGNVRELRNAMERALVLVDGGTLRLEHMPDAVRAPSAPATAAAGAIKEQVADLELRAIEAALAAENGNQTRAARRLGISRRALIYKLEKYNLTKKSS